MNSQYSKNLSLIMDEVEECNTCITNHVGTHGNDYVRKGIIFLLQAATLFTLIFIL